MLEVHLITRLVRPVNVGKDTNIEIHIRTGEGGNRPRGASGPTQVYTAGPKGKIELGM